MTTRKGFLAFLMAVFLMSAVVTPWLIGAVEASGFAGGDGSLEDPYQIDDVEQLQAIGDDLSAHYVIIGDIDASETTDWNGGAGFEPIGDNMNHFSGTLQGNGHTVSGIFINRTSTDYVGLFGYVYDTAEINGVRLTDVDVSGNHYVGGLLGHNHVASIDKCYSDGNVSGIDYHVGGLVGRNYGSIDHSSSDADVSGGSSAGGLVGWNSGDVVRSHATGDVNGTFSVGGLVGYISSGTVNQSYANGVVNGTEHIGGLAGYNSGGIIRSHATGAVDGRVSGGLVGYNKVGAILQSYATGAVNGSHNIGGLVAENDGGGTIDQSYATGEVTGAGSVGGLVGFNDGVSVIDQSYAAGDVSSTGDYAAGLVGRNYGTIDQSYSVGNVSGDYNSGGLVAGGSGTVTGSYWDTETSNQMTSTGGVGYTTAQMKQESNYDGWDFDDVWWITDGETYPELLNISPLIIGVEISLQPNLDYGEADLLDLTDMQVTLSYSSGSDFTYTWAVGGNLSSSPGHGTSLTEADHNNLTIEVIHDPSGFSARTAPLNVGQSQGEEPPSNGTEPDDDPSLNETTPEDDPPLNETIPGDEETVNEDDDICAVPFAIMLIFGMSVMAMREF